MCHSLYLHSCKRTGASQVKALASCWPSGILCEQTLTIRAAIQRHCLPLQPLLSLQTSPFLSGEERQGIIYAHWHRYTHLDSYSYKHQGENIFKWPTEGCWLNSEAGSCRLLPVVWFEKMWTASQGWLLKLYTVVLGSISSDSQIHVCPIWTVSERRAPQVGTLNVYEREIRSRKQDRDIF